MDIISRLKKEKRKEEAVLDSLVKKSQAREGVATKPVDMEITPLLPEKSPIPDAEIEGAKEMAQKREFRSGGMYEFELDSLGTAPDAGLKAEYKARLGKLIDEGQIDEAIGLLQELKQKLAE